MNEWIIVAAVAGGTIALLGGWGFVQSVVKGRDKRDS